MNKTKVGSLKKTSDSTSPSTEQSRSDRQYVNRTKKVALLGH